MRVCDVPITDAPCPDAPQVRRRGGVRRFTDNALRAACAVPGATATSVARALGCSESLVYAHSARLGIAWHGKGHGGGCNGGRKRREQWTAGEDDLVRRVCARELRALHAMQQLGCTLATLKDRAGKLGLQWPVYFASRPTGRPREYEAVEKVNDHCAVGPAISGTDYEYPTVNKFGPDPYLAALRTTYGRPRREEYDPHAAARARAAALVPAEQKALLVWAR